MVDPRNGARAVIRDTGADAGRFLWSVLAAGEMDPMSEGRTDELAQARSIAEAALCAYAETNGTAARHAGAARNLSGTPAPIAGFTMKGADTALT
jgi:hypothetical protein